MWLNMVVLREFRKIGMCVHDRTHEMNQEQ
jgi:hypothetical protein